MKKLKLFTAALIVSSPAYLFAHGMIDSTYPKDGAMLMDQAQYVEMDFTSAVKITSVKLVSSSGLPVTISYDRKMFASMAMEKVKIELPDLAPDSYTVYWKALGDDGHSMEGEFGFMQH